MIDAEVTRLRRLRMKALNARALAARLELESSTSRHTVFSLTAGCCWQIARVVTGRLKAHPYLSYQREPGEFSILYAEIRARLLRSAAQYNQRSFQALADELQSVARELDDARALTWSADLSDTFGRSQAQLRGLLAEVKAGARKEAGSCNDIVADAQTDAVEEASTLAGDWPYLAF